MANIGITIDQPSVNQSVCPRSHNIYNGIFLYTNFSMFQKVNRPMTYNTSKHEQIRLTCHLYWLLLIVIFTELRHFRVSPT